MKSMTGFGSARRAGAGFVVTVEWKSVNHAKLDVRVHAPPQAQPYVADVEEMARKDGGRGRIEGWIKLESEEDPGFRFAAQRAAKAYEALTALRDELCPGEPAPFAMLTAVPQLFASGGQNITADPVVAAAINGAAAEALQALGAMRAREGEALAKDFVARVAAIRTGAQAIATRSPASVTSHIERLRNRIAELLTDGSAPLDEGRLEREAVLYADRIDVTEELVRLEAHCDHFLQAMKVEDDALGKRLEFMLQEMGREVNTAGSKSLDTGIAHTIVEMKVELARMREQIQNIL